MSWRTTTAGLIAAISAVVLAVMALTDGVTADEVETLVSAVVALSIGFGLIAARDNKKTSEDVGIK